MENRMYRCTINKPFSVVHRCCWQVMTDSPPSIEQRLLVKVACGRSRTVLVPELAEEVSKYYKKMDRDIRDAIELNENTFYECHRNAHIHTSQTDCGFVIFAPLRCSTSVW